MILTLSPQQPALAESPHPLRERGMAALKVGRCEEAESLFNEVLAAEPTNLAARYGRGLSRSCLGEFDLAAEDLLDVARGWPDRPDVALELGAALSSAGSYKEAAPWLAIAQADPQFEGPASLLLGLGQLRFGNLDAARTSFTRAMATPTLAAQAQYYAGVVEYRAGNLAAAEDRFSALAQSQRDTALGREAAAFVAAIRIQQRGVYDLYAGFGLEYDSNVLLLPTDDQLVAPGVPGGADGRATFRAGGGWQPLHDPVEIKLRYDFFQSLQFQLTDFDLQAHQPSLELTKAIGPVQLGSHTRYEFYLRKESLSPFVHQWWVRPWVRAAEGEFGQAEVYYSGRGQKFLEEAFETLDGYEHAFGAQQLVWFGGQRRYGLLGYQYSFTDLDDVLTTIVPSPGVPPAQVPIENPFAYTANQVKAEVGWDLPFDVRGAVRYIFRRQDYSPTSQVAPGTPVRQDNRHEVAALLWYPINEYVEVLAGYTGFFNDSNQALFTYNRNVCVVSASLRY